MGVSGEPGEAIAVCYYNIKRVVMSEVYCHQAICCLDFDLFMQKPEGAEKDSIFPHILYTIMLYIMLLNKFLECVTSPKNNDKTLYIYFPEEHNGSLLKMFILDLL